jgi:hypothetical protein
MPFGTIARWISGDDPNKESRAAEREQQGSLNTQTSLSNQYNLNIYKTDKKNYEEEREYAYDTAITNWEYGKQIQDYQYAQSLAAFEKSQDIYEGQLGYNEQAASLAVSDQEASIQDLALSQAFQREAMHSDLMNTIKSEGSNLMTEIKSAGIGKLEQGAKLYGIKSGRRIGTESVQQTLNEITKQNTFEKEAKFVESLQKGGKAALGQAGVSRAKSLQSTAAESFRDLVALDSSLSGSRNKAAVDLLKLQVDASIAETQVGLNLDRLALGVASAKDRYELSINSAVEEVKYNNKILSANMRSATSQMARNINQIELQKHAADLQAQANLNLFPEEFDYAPEPQLPPMRRFVEPPEFVAPTVPKGSRVSTGVSAAVDIVGELGQAVSIAMGIPGVGKALGGGLTEFGKLFGIGNASAGAGAVPSSAANAAGWAGGMGNQNY